MDFIYERSDGAGIWVGWESITAKSIKQSLTDLFAFLKVRLVFDISIYIKAMFFLLYYKSFNQIFSLLTRFLSGPFVLIMS